MVWAEMDLNGNVEALYVRSAAALRIAGYMGGPWSLLIALWIIPKPLRDWAYDLVARHRHRLQDGDTCITYSDEVKMRFLDS